MTEGKVEIFLSYKEPEYRDNLMWLRPYLDREGYELLYYGANGWTRFIPCHQAPSYLNSDNIEIEKPIVGAKSDSPLTEIKPSMIGDTEGNLYEITSSMYPPDNKSTCGCPND